MNIRRSILQIYISDSCYYDNDLIWMILNLWELDILQMYETIRDIYFDRNKVYKSRDFL